MAVDDRERAKQTRIIREGARAADAALGAWD
jgi:hypothetical protein